MKTSTAHKLRSCLFAATSLLLSLDAAQAHSPSFSEGLVQAQDPASKKWGYLNKKGEWALPPKFEKAYEFRSGRALVMQGDQTMFIEQSGKVAFISKWKVEPWAGFHGGLLRVVEDGKQGFVDTSGELTIAPEYDKAENFSEDLAAVSKGGKWGFIDTRGKLVVPMEWDSVGRFSNGLAWVSRERKTGFVNKTGELVVPLQFARAQDFKNGHASVFDGNVEDGNRVINTKGEVLSPPNSEWRSWEIVGDDRVVFGVESATSITGKLIGVADSKGNVLVKPTWASIGIGSGFDSGLARATLPGATRREWGKTCYINRDGKIVIPYFDYSNWFQEGLAFAKDGDKLGYIDITGKFVFELPKKPLIIEGEKLVASAKVSGGIVEAQVLPGVCSAGAQLWWKDAAVGNSLKLLVDTSDLPSGTCDLSLYPMCARDYAKVSIEIQGQKKEVDLYRPDLTPGSPILFHNLTIAPKTPLQVTVGIIGKNDLAIPNHMFGLDRLEFIGAASRENKAEAEKGQQVTREITIIKALYGSREQFANGKERDVTEKARKFLVDGRLHIPHSRQAFGDPHPYKGKLFRMTYQLDGKNAADGQPLVFEHKAGEITFDPSNPPTK
jgi:hypothetical protein